MFYGDSKYDDNIFVLNNRRAFYRKTDRVFLNMGKESKAALILIDLDNLKMVNDKYGHLAEDKYLLAIAEVLHLFEGKNRIASKVADERMYNKRFSEKIILERDSVRINI